MELLNRTKFFLILSLALLSAPAFAQENTGPTPLTCGSEGFDTMLYVVECAKEKCPYAGRQQGVYELICAPEIPGEMARKRGLQEALDKVGGPEALPAAANTPTLNPCDCLAKLEEKFACGIETCAATEKMSTPATGKNDFPAGNDPTSAGCSLATTQPQSHADMLAWAAMFVVSLWLMRRTIIKRKYVSVFALCILVGSAVGCSGGSGSGAGEENAANSPAGSSGMTPTSPGSNLWLTAYYPSYRQFEMPPAEFDYTAMTHLIHWPVLPKTDGSLDTVKMDFTPAHSADVVTRAHAAGIKVLLGVGGNTDSGATAGFQGATTAANRTTFIKNMVALMQSRGYDGVDINWEEIRPADDAQFVALIRELRQALDAVSPRPLLTMPPTTGFDGRPELIAQIHQHLDQINLQTYVMSGAYPGWVTWHNSPLSNGGEVFPSNKKKLPSVEVEVERFANAGIPLNRMAIGAQFDAVAKVPFLGRDSANNADDRFVSFDDEQAISEKAAYLKAKGLGGMFLFEIAGDYLPGQAQPHPLLNAAKESVLSK